jgi:[ribosomal protein S18]-alanine N-acetyltransferase
MPEIRRGEPGDLDDIDRIQTASPEAAQWSAADYLSYDLRVAILGGSIAGFLVVRENGPGEWEILNLAVAPEYRRRGIARKLVESFQTSIDGCVFLEVRESNNTARKFYNSMGFQEVTRRREYYKTPPDAAIVMKFHSC